MQRIPYLHDVRGLPRPEKDSDMHPRGENKIRFSDAPHSQFGNSRREQLLLHVPHEHKDSDN